ncbi:MAG: hypothetical protein K6L73_10040 [Cellvibrionaceae bacterium]
MDTPVADQQLFESITQSLEAQIINAGAHLTLDAKARHLYSQQIKLFSNDLRLQAQQGKISWAQAADQASSLRNSVMDIVRSKSTPVGRALAQQLKSEGKTLNQMLVRKTQQLFGTKKSFDTLSLHQQNQVYSEIVKAAGKSNPSVTATMQKLSIAGRSLIFLSIAISVYSVATAENKFDVAGREVAISGAGIGGGITGGALAGVACGPGAPVCVTVGAFIGGALAAFGVSMAW